MIRTQQSEAERARRSNFIRESKAANHKDGRGQGTACRSCDRAVKLVGDDFALHHQERLSTMIARIDEYSAASAQSLPVTGCPS